MPERQLLPALAFENKRTYRAEAPERSSKWSRQKSQLDAAPESQGSRAKRREKTPTCYFSAVYHEQVWNSLPLLSLRVSVCPRFAFTEGFMWGAGLGRRKLSCAREEPPHSFPTRGARSAQQPPQERPGVPHQKRSGCAAEMVSWTHREDNSTT